jgi:hypothetical protein
MKLNKKVLGAAVALAVVSTSAFAVAPFGNNTQRGSALAWPRIEVTTTSDTLVTLINDFGYGNPVNLKCYYLAPGDTYASKKYVKDFTKKPTSNQPLFWWASSGKTVSSTLTTAGGGTTVIPVKFSPFPPLAGIGSGSAVAKTAGELKCWAVGTDGLPMHFNHLSGTGSIVNANGTAMEYNAFAFEALDGGRSTANTGNKISGSTDGLPGGDAQLQFDVVHYDDCPVQLLGSYFPAGKTQLTIIGCNQDVRQDRSIFVTKLNYTFWDADENAVTGWYECSDSWYERWLGDIGGAAIDSPIAYFRVYGAPSTVCTPTGNNAGLLGIKIESDSAGSMYRGTNLIGRGEYTGGAWKYNITNQSGAPQ